MLILARKRLSGDLTWVEVQRAVAVANKSIAFEKANTARVRSGNFLFSESYKPSRQAVEANYVTYQGNQMAHQQYESCIEACFRCASACSYSATAGMHQENPKPMVRYIALAMDCADLCMLAATLMARGSAQVERICKLCIEICAACSAECTKGRTDYCQASAAACRHCADECRRMIGSR